MFISCWAHTTDIRLFVAVVEGHVSLLFHVVGRAGAQYHCTFEVETRGGLVEWWRRLGWCGPR
jgi:hypothetical protein